MGSFLSKNKLPLIAGILMLVIIPIAVAISGQVTNLTPRAAVEKTEQSKLTLSALTNMPVGQEFFIDIHLDTTKDPKFVISGVDAIITYDPKYLEISSMNLGSALDTITQQNIDAAQGKITVSLSNNAVQDSNGNPVGYSGEAAIVSLKAKALKTGKTSLKYVYDKASSTSDTNVIGFLKNKPLADQASRERLLSEPRALSLTITNTVTSSPTPSAIPSPTPRASCVPRPACLDANPACLLAPADPGTVFCPPSPRPSATPTPTPKPTVSLQIQLDMPGRDNKAISGTLYGLDASVVKGVTIAQGFESVGGPAPEEVQRNTSKTPVQTLATFTTNTSGMANVEIPAKFQGKSMWLYVRTPSHLVRKTPAPVTLSYDTTTCAIGAPCPLRPIAIQQVSFTNLIPGDIYIAPNQTEQDNIINTFDALEMVKNLGTTAAKADLNSDGSVNARDYQILLANLNKTGDAIGTTSTPPSASLPPISCPQVYEPVCCSGRTYSNQCTASTTGATSCRPGTCKSLPTSPIPLSNPPSTKTTCPDAYNPVCASNGQTYNNECLAEAQGLYWTRGACNSAQ